MSKEQFARQQKQKAIKEKVVAEKAMKEKRVAEKAMEDEALDTSGFTEKQVEMFKEQSEHAQNLLKFFKFFNVAFIYSRQDEVILERIANTTLQLNRARLKNENVEDRLKQNKANLAAYGKLIEKQYADNRARIKELNKEAQVRTEWNQRFEEFWKNAWK